MFVCVCYVIFSWYLFSSVTQKVEERRVCVCLWMMMFGSFNSP